MCRGKSDMGLSCRLCKKSVSKIQQALRPQLQLQDNCNITHSEHDSICIDGFENLARTDYVCKNYPIEILFSFLALDDGAYQSATEACASQGADIGKVGRVKTKTCEETHLNVFRFRFV